MARALKPQVQRALQLAAEGRYAAEIAREIGYTDAGVSLLLKRHGVRAGICNCSKAQDPKNMARATDAICQRVHGISHQEAVALNDGLALMLRGSKMDRYHMQKKAAKKRGIEWAISFAEWVGLWNDSGMWEKRGVSKGCYCMGRNGDTGPYKIGNVKIISVFENHSESGSRTRGPQKGWAKVCKNRLKPFQVRIKNKTIGHFATPEEACSARLAAVAASKLAQASQGR